MTSTNLRADYGHSRPDRIPQDNRRNNAHESKGYTVVRFNTLQIREQMAEYCIPNILTTVERLGGIQDPTGLPLTYKTTVDGIAAQGSLFE